MSIDRILVPLDGTPFAERALPIAARLARVGGGTLVLARVEEPRFPPAMTGLGDVVAPIPGIDEMAFEASAVYLETVASRLRAAGMDVRSAVLDGDLGHALREACEREHVGLVVMASRARGGVARFLLGSAADRVLHGGPRVPLLVVRGGADDVVEREIARVAVALDTDDDAEATVDAAAEIARPTGAALTLLLPNDREPPTRLAQALAAQGMPVEVRVVEGDDVADAVARTVTELRADVVAVGARGAHALASSLRHAVDAPVLVVPPRER